MTSARGASLSGENSGSHAIARDFVGLDQRIRFPNRDLEPRGLDGGIELLELAHARNAIIRNELDPPHYQTLRSDLRGAAMNASGDKADALHDIVNSLDDAMERSMVKTNPADSGAARDRGFRFLGWL